MHILSANISLKIYNPFVVNKNDTMLWNMHKKDIANILDLNQWSIYIRHNYKDIIASTSVLKVTLRFFMHMLSATISLKYI